MHIIKAIKKTLIYLAFHDHIFFICGPSKEVNVFIIMKYVNIFSLDMLSADDIVLINETRRSS